MYLTQIENLRLHSLSINICGRPTKAFIWTYWDCLMPVWKYYAILEKYCGFEVDEFSDINRISHFDISKETSNIPNDFEWASLWELVTRFSLSGI